MLPIEFKNPKAIISVSSPSWAPPNSIEFNTVDLELYGILLAIIEWFIIYVWVGYILRDCEQLKFPTISLSGRVSLCILLIFCKAILAFSNFFGTLYMYHTIVSGSFCLFITTLALLFQEGPLKCLRANNRKSLMPSAPDLPGFFLQIIQDRTIFKDGKGFIQVPFLFYELYIDTYYWNFMTYKYYKTSLRTYMTSLAQHSEGYILVSRMIMWLDGSGYIRRFTFRLPSSNLLKHLQDTELTAVELISYQYPEENRVRYYYGEITEFGYKLTESQKKTVRWLLSLLNDCAIENLRSHKVDNFIRAGVSILLAGNKSRKRSRSRENIRSPHGTIPGSPITAELDHGIKWSCRRSPSPLSSRIY
ncbi:hypothetical protein WA158_001222 [Blastocystis sp. Blastoise]